MTWELGGRLEMNGEEKSLGFGRSLFGNPRIRVPERRYRPTLAHVSLRRVAFPPRREEDR